MVTPVSTSRPDPVHPDQGPPRRRRRQYIAGTLFLALAALAVAQWLLAEDSGARWLAGVQCVLAIALAVSTFAQARSSKTGKRSQ